VQGTAADAVFQTGFLPFWFIAGFFIGWIFQITGRRCQEIIKALSPASESVPPSESLLCFHVSDCLVQLPAFIPESFQFVGSFLIVLRCGSKRLLRLLEKNPVMIGILLPAEAFLLQSLSG